MGIVAAIFWILAGIIYVVYKLFKESGISLKIIVECFKDKGYLTFLLFFVIIPVLCKMGLNYGTAYHASLFQKIVFYASVVIGLSDALFSLGLIVYCVISDYNDKHK